MKTHYKNILLISSFILLITGEIISQTDSVYYHDYSFESQWGANGAYPNYDNDRYVTRFTPPYYPAKLVGIKAWFRNVTDATSTTRAVWYVDPTGDTIGPGAIFGTLGATIYTNPAIGGIADTSYAKYMDVSYSNTIINSGEVYAGCTQHNMLNGYLGIAIDGQNAYSSNRPWVSSAGWYRMVNWCFVNGEWGINAYFSPVTIGVNELKTDYNVSVYPNPINENTIVTYELKENTAVNLAVFNMIGEKVAEVITNEKQVSGSHSLDLASLKLKSGVYFLRLNNETVKICKL